MTSNPFPWGQCTYYVASRYPAIIGHIHGDAYTWLQSAADNGYSTSNRARPGWVVVYGQGSGYDSRFGHVAVVESVSGDGRSFVVSEMNVKGLGVVDQRSSTYSGVEGFFLPPGAPASASLFADTSVQSSANPGDTTLTADAGSWYAPIVSAILNTLLVIGGGVFMGAGIWLGAMSDEKSRSALMAQQNGKVMALTNRATQDRKENRATLRKAVKPTIREGVSNAERRGAKARYAPRPSAADDRAHPSKVREVKGKFTNPRNATYSGGSPITEEIPF